MADIQKQFEQFHGTIRVDYDMAEELRTKRDIVVQRIEKYLKDNKLPGVSVLLQGSYKMKTGAKPIADLEYDIDIGLRFDFKPEEHAAADVRKWIYDAVDGHTNKCEDKGPCIRVYYEKGLHLDLVTYCVWKDALGAEQYRLAHKTKGWREANPPKLLEHVEAARKPYDGTEDGATKTDQFRRVVRCLRRWNDVRIPSEDEKKPTGLAYVILCCERLTPRKFMDGRPDDRQALEDVTRSISQALDRVKAPKPTPEYEDLLVRLSDTDMERFKKDVGKLHDALKEAGTSADPVKACTLLRKQFGEDFPVPTPEETGTKTAAPAITTSSVSAG